MRARPTPITSRQHPFIRRCRDLAAGRVSEGEVLLDGPHLVQDAVTAHVPLLGLVVDDERVAWAAGVGTATTPLYVAPPDLLAAASPVRSSSGVVAIARWSPADGDALIAMESARLVGLVDIQDPGNVGGIIRSADALGATGVLALGRTAHPGGWRALRGAMGSTFRLPVGLGATGDVLIAARARGLTVISTVAAGGVPLNQASLDRPFLLLVGNEGAGLPSPLAQAADMRITIPMREGVNSLNVGVSAALVLWEAGRQAHPEGLS